MQLEVQDLISAQGGMEAWPALEKAMIGVGISLQILRRGVLKNVGPWERSTLKPTIMAEEISAWRCQITHWYFRSKKHVFVVILHNVPLVGGPSWGAYWDADDYPNECGTTSGQLARAWPIWTF